MYIESMYLYIMGSVFASRRISENASRVYPFSANSCVLSLPAIYVLMVSHSISVSSRMFAALLSAEAFSAEISLRIFLNVFEVKMMLSETNGTISSREIIINVLQNRLFRLKLCI